MSVTVSIEIFLQTISKRQVIVLDTRSPGEYNHGHIPGSVSFPLMNDEERIVIGTTYKQSGREDAVLKGFELVGPKFANFIVQALKLSPDKEVMIYCWRGGMRSNIMAWILSTAGFKVTLLKGGYKSFRNWALSQFETKKNIIIIGGKTGSGKTELLNEIEKCGERVIDLEALAHHKGSAFGSLGQLPQPSTEHFENLLAMQWSKTNLLKVLWLENESLLIGTCAIPNDLFDMMRNADVIEINLPYEIRKKRILNEYGNFDTESLAEKTKKVKKRLGGLRLKNAINFLEEKNLSGWCEVMMDYYDNSYHHSNQLRNKARVHNIELEEDDMKMNAKKIIEFAQTNISDFKQSIPQALNSKL